MKTALIITSLTSLVNGYPNIDSIVDKHEKTFSKKARKVNVKTDGIATEAINEDLEIDAIIGEGTKKKTFQVEFGNSCSDLTVKVAGFQTDICVNEIGGDPDEDDVGESFSFRYVNPGDGGVPKIEYHWGHQCRMKVFEGDMLDLTELGFPSGYPIGSCHNFMDPTNTYVMYSGKAHWTGGMLEPNYPYVVKAKTNKDRNCDKKYKFHRYDIERTDIDMCFDTEDDDGNISYYKWITTNCHHSTMASIDRKYYSDEMCTSFDHIRKYYHRNCNFDTDKFIGSFDNNESAVFEYIFQDCQNNPN